MIEKNNFFTFFYASFCFALFSLYLVSYKLYTYLIHFELNYPSFLNYNEYSNQNRTPFVFFNMEGFGLFSREANAGKPEINNFYLKIVSNVQRTEYVYRKLLIKISL